MSKRIVYFGVLVCVLLSLLGGCGASEREYKEDIVVELADRDGVLVIRKWSYLVGSGAEVYYEYGWSKPMLLGQTSGSDNGYCPFAAGEYRIAQNGDTVEISWRFNGTGTWRSKGFVLPDEVALKRRDFSIVMAVGLAVLTVGILFVIRRRRRNRALPTES